MQERFTALPIGVYASGCRRAAAVCVCLFLPFGSMAAERGDLDEHQHSPPTEGAPEQHLKGELGSAKAEDKDLQQEQKAEPTEERRQAGPHPPHG